MVCALLLIFSRVCFFNHHCEYKNIRLRLTSKRCICDPRATVLMNFHSREKQRGNSLVCCPGIHQFSKAKLIVGFRINTGVLNCRGRRPRRPILFGFYALRVGCNLCLRGWRTRVLEPYPCEPRHQREEEHLRVLILSSLESPLLALRAATLISFHSR